jgi:hypothetical protein
MMTNKQRHAFHQTGCHVAQAAATWGRRALTVPAGVGTDAPL